MFPLSGATSIIIERIAGWLNPPFSSNDGKFTLGFLRGKPKEKTPFFGMNGFFFKTSVNFCQSKDVWTTGDSYSMAGIDLSWPHQVKWVVSEQQKLLKLGYYMDKFRFFVWIILNYWIMIIDHLPIFAWWQNVTPKVFSPSFRWESMTCLPRGELLRSRMRAEARSIFHGEQTSWPWWFALDVGIYRGCYPPVN